MINLGIKLSKGLEFFSKKEKKQDKTQILIQILDRIEKDNPDNEEQLQDIKIDLAENIPLTNEKKIYLKKVVDSFKIAKKNPKQEMEKQVFKTIYKIPEFENSINSCATLIDTLKQIIKKIEENVDSLYQEIDAADGENKIWQLKERNDMFRNNLRQIISNLNITNTEVLNQISKAKSVQTKMAILDNELDLKNNCL
ncbi:hypothetical protein [Nitrosopumilus ureiphilus]|uniref:hypothetical protein n=1 Tax=Nitrosopumilus ureiphilus TaxID=1470067 RepID=UPI0015CAD64B|nr:hypothetical protein [Nitrosopumilus ureiphilus]